MFTLKCIGCVKSYIIHDYSFLNKNSSVQMPSICWLPQNDNLLDLMMPRSNTDYNIWFHLSILEKTRILTAA